LKILDLGGEVGPEHVAERDGKLYIAVESGKVLRMNLDGSQRETWVDTRGGRVLGLVFDAKGRLLVADAFRGLWAYDANKAGERLVDAVNVGGKADPVRYADAVVVAPSGTPNAGMVYFSDASTRFGAKAWGGTFEASVLDILEQSATGRIIEYNPESRASRVVAQGLSFANGLVLTPDGQQLLVAETGKYRVWQISTRALELDVSKLPASTGSAPSGQQASVLLNNLPGYPDNLMPAPAAANGTPQYWLGFAKPRSAVVDALATKPWARKATLRLPRTLWPVPPAYGHVIRFDARGKITADLQDPSGKYPESTGVTQVGNQLFIQSLHAKGLGVMTLNESVSKP
jgi:sugar lactone lactonase YvrE